MKHFRTCSAVVIAVPQHRRFVSDILNQLSDGETNFDEIVLVLSGFNRMAHASRYPSKPRKFREILVLHQPLQSAGANRNAGLAFATKDLVFFHDADDVYSPHRTSVALSLFEHHKFDLMLHGFTPFIDGDSPSPFPDPPEDINEIEVVREESLYDATLLHSPRNRSLELQGKTETTNLLFNDPSEAFEVQHAHAIVRREALGSIRFHEEFGIRNEDGVFARDMLEAGKRVVLSPFVLSAYRHGARAKPMKFSSFFNPKT